MSETFFTSTNIGATNDFIAKMETIQSFTPVMKRGNVVHAYVDICEFFEIFKDWKEQLIWNKQRPINNEKVDQIYQSYKNNIKDMMYFSISPIISIGTVKGQNPKIIDGQHRLSALELWVEPDTAGFYIPFHIADYADDNLRFRAFCDVNSNTQLPDIYKAVSDKDVRWRRMAEGCMNAIKDLDILKPYTYVPSKVGVPMHVPKFNIEACKDKIFTYIKTKNIDIQLTGDIDNELTMFFAKFQDITVKYNNELADSGITSFNKDGLINPNMCIACENKNSKNQCNHPKKKNDKCGVHDGTQTPICDAGYVRKALYDNVTKTGSFVLMYTDYSWVGDVLDLVDNKSRTMEDMIATTSHKKKLVILKKKLIQ
jgi:hypothetical protein